MGDLKPRKVKLWVSGSYSMNPTQVGNLEAEWCSYLWWHIAVHLLGLLHLLRGMTFRGRIFLLLLNSCGRPALGGAHVHGRQVPRCAGTVGGIIKISLEVNAHSWGGHIAFDNIFLILWSMIRRQGVSFEILDYFSLWFWGSHQGPPETHLAVLGMGRHVLLGIEPRAS